MRARSEKIEVGISPADAEPVGEEECDGGGGVNVGDVHEAVARLLAHVSNHVPVSTHRQSTDILICSEATQ